jgi:hypothetical protein
MKENSLHNFLNDLGITNISEPTKKYLLDMSNSTDTSSQSSVVLNKFNTHLNSVKGGAILMPMEYFNPNHNGPYNPTSEHTSTFKDANPGNLTSGLKFNMPIKPQSGGLFAYNMFDKLNLNKVKANKNVKRYVIDKLNVDVSDMINKAAKSHPQGKLTKTNLKKFMK